jgi:hypothetical protein
MMKARLRLDEVDKAYFTQIELKNVGLTDEERNKLQDEPSRRRLAHWWRGWEFSGPLIFVLWIGAILIAKNNP